MRWFWNLFFPPFCGGCDWIGTYLCEKCASELTFLPPQLEKWWYTHSESGGCKVTVQSLVAYAHPASTLLKRMKYTPVLELTDEVSRLLYAHTEKPSNIEIITSVPAHPNKKRHRGFDQSELIAKKLAKWWKIPYAPLLERRESGGSLVDQHSKEERLEAARSVFSLRSESRKVCEKLGVKRVLLIDDVITTGSTAKVCAQLLSQLGAQQIHILTFAQTI